LIQDPSFPNDGQGIDPEPNPPIDNGSNDGDGNTSEGEVNPEEREAPPATEPEGIALTNVTWSPPVAAMPPT
jgi:hypothetical protein